MPHSRLVAPFCAFAMVNACPAPAQSQRWNLAAPPAIAPLQLARTWVGDIDGDGDQDVVGLAPAFIYSAVYLLQNDGNGQFSNVTTGRMPLFLLLVNDLALFDADGDSDLDMFLAGNTGCMFLRNDGTGSFTLDTDFPGQTQNRVTPADLDGDGDVDLALATSLLLGGSELLMRNDGTGGFTIALYFGFGTLAVGFVALDHDGDGDLDLLHAGQRVLRRNDGNFTFTDVTASQLSMPAMTVGAVATGDLDGDGDLDVVFGDANGLADPVVFDTGPMLQQNGSLPQRSRTYAIELMDVDDDGDLDAVRSHGTGTLSLAVNDGLGHFTDATASLPPLTIYSTHVRAGDLDHDGDADLLTCYTAASTLVLWNRVRQLEVGVAARGQTWNVDLWHRPGFAAADAIGRVAITLGQLPAPLVLPGIGRFWLDPTGGLLLVTDVVPQASGRRTFAFAIPAVPALQGIALCVQGLVEEPSGPRLTALGVATIQ